MNTLPMLAVIVPVYNEHASLTSTLEHLVRVLAPTGWTYEIIVVDDGSTDGSCTNLPPLPITVVTHVCNQGYGAALKTGLAQSRAPLVVIMDADGTYPLEALPQLVQGLSSADMVVGARIGAHVRVPLVRRPVKWGMTLLAQLFVGQVIPDLNSGLRAMRRTVVTAFVPVLPDGFSFTSTITLALLLNHHRVQYVPIDYYQRTGCSKIRPVYDTLNSLRLILTTVARYHRTTWRGRLAALIARLV